jgi:hypothetical protein
MCSHATSNSSSAVSKFCDISSTVASSLVSDDCLQTLSGSVYGALSRINLTVGANLTEIEGRPADWSVGPCRTDVNRETDRSVSRPLDLNRAYIRAAIVLALRERVARSLKVT